MARSCVTWRHTWTRCDVHTAHARPCAWAVIWLLHIHLSCVNLSSQHAVVSGLAHGALCVTAHPDKQTARTASCINSNYPLVFEPCTLYFIPATHTWLLTPSSPLHASCTVHRSTTCWSGCHPHACPHATAWAVLARTSREVDQQCQDVLMCMLLHRSMQASWACAACWHVTTLGYGQGGDEVCAS